MRHHKRVKQAGRLEEQGKEGKQVGGKSHQWTWTLNEGRAAAAWKQRARRDCCPRGCRYTPSRLSDGEAAGADGLPLPHL